MALGLFAHPASNVTLGYDVKTQLLTVNFDHSVKNTADHFISKVVVSIGGKAMLTHNLTNQETAVGGSLIYKLPNLKSGSVIEVTTECNKVGKKSAKLTLK
jgi:hypothetical protein